MGRAVCCICRVLFSHYFFQDLRGLQFQVPVVGVVPDHTDAAGIPGAGSGDTVAHHPLLDLVLGNYHARECTGRGNVPAGVVRVSVPRTRRSVTVTFIVMPRALTLPDALCRVSPGVRMEGSRVRPPSAVIRAFFQSIPLRTETKRNKSL